MRRQLCLHNNNISFGSRSIYIPFCQLFNRFNDLIKTNKSSYNKQAKPVYIRCCLVYGRKQNSHDFGDIRTIQIRINYKFKVSVKVSQHGSNEAFPVLLNCVTVEMFSPGPKTIYQLQLTSCMFTIFKRH